MVDRVEDNLGAAMWRPRRHPLWLQGRRMTIRAHPDQSPDPRLNTNISHLTQLLCCVLIINSPGVQDKESVIFEQISQLVGVNAYLHVHVELSISTVEAHLNKYCQL
jgi:hypothetical protein